MRLELSNAASIEAPDDDAIARALAGLDDVGDCARLTDPAQGEIRAAGPAADGTFFLRCQLSGPGDPFEGDRGSVPLTEAVDLFQRFRRGDTEWRTDFDAPGTPLFAPGRHRIAAIVAAVILFILAALWRAV